MKRGILDRLLESHAARQAVALLTHIESGTQCLVFMGDEFHEDERTEQDVLIPAAVNEARRLLKERRSASIEVSGARFIVRTYVPPPRLFVVGAVHIAQALLPMAALVGFQVHLIDPRDAFGAETRFPGLDVNRQWPDQALAALSLDTSSAVVTLSHDPKIDDPALQAALASDAFYVGALGSRKTHAGRMKRLSARGIGSSALARIHAPVGLPLGGRDPAEIAVSILAQIIEARSSSKNSGTGQHLV